MSQNSSLSDLSSKVFHYDELEAYKARPAVLRRHVLHEVLRSHRVQFLRCDHLLRRADQDVATPRRCHLRRGPAPLLPSLSGFHSSHSFISSAIHSLSLSFFLDLPLSQKPKKSILIMVLRCLRISCLHVK